MSRDGDRKVLIVTGGSRGIRVNAVSPGRIDTEIHEAAGGADRLRQHLGTVPAGRIGAAAEVAGTIVWLAAEAPAHVAGANIIVSGGR